MGPEGLPRFLQAAMQPNMFDVYHPNLTGGPFNIGSFFGDGNIGQAVNMALMPYMHRFISSQGMAPGQFTPVQNVYDQMLARQQQMHAQQTMTAATARDRARVQATLTHAYKMIQPGELSRDQTAFVGDLSEYAMKALPYLAPMMPGTIDQLMGETGSQSIFAMGMSRASRYLADARGVTGGITGTETGAMSDRLFAELYGNRRAIRDMRGIGGASAGQLMTEMSQRGQLGELFGDRLDGGKTAGTFDAARTARKIKDMAGAVSAMRDIFGDMGRADAPMSELINGLEALTQGGMSKMDRSRVEKLVRDTQQLAKMTGVGIDAVFAMQAAAGQMAEGAGLDRSFAPGAVSGSLAFGMAYGQLESGTSWRKMNKEQMMALDQRLRLQAAGSETANQAGAIMRLGDQGLLSGPAKDLYNRIRAGDSQAIDYRTPGDFIKLLTDSGISAGAAQAAMLAGKANQESVQKYNLADPVRARQAEIDIRSIVGSTVGQGVMATLNDRERGFGGKITDTITQALMAMKGETRDDPTKRLDALTGAVASALGARGLEAFGANPEARQRRLREIIETGYATADDTIQRTPGWDQYQSMNNLLAANSPEIMKRASRIQAQASIRAGMARALSGLGQQGPLRRIIDELGRDGNKDFSTLAARFLGGTRYSDQVNELRPALQEISDKQKRYEALAAKLESLAGVPGKERERASISEEMNRLEGEIAELTSGREGLTDQNMAGLLAMSGASSQQELLRGTRGDGSAIDKTLVNQARRMVGLTETAKALGLDPASMQNRKTMLLNELGKVDPSKRGDVLAAIDATRRDLLSIARKAGRFTGREDNEITSDEIDRLMDDSRAGTFGGEGLKALHNLPAGVLRKLDAGSIGLDEYRKRVESAGSKELTLTGEVTIKDDRKARLAFKGVPSLSGGATA